MMRYDRHARILVAPIIELSLTGNGSKAFLELLHKYDGVYLRQFHLQRSEHSLPCQVETKVLRRFDIVRTAKTYRTHPCRPNGVQKQLVTNPTLIEGESPVGKARTKTTRRPHCRLFFSQCRFPGRGLVTARS